MTYGRLVGALVVALAGCAAEGESICKTVGREGVLLSSIDRVLTIAISPESVDDPVEICIAQSMSAPEVAGPAYRVKPAIPLNYSATITYRHALPDDTSEINIGRIDGEDFDAGMGRWESLPDCRVNASDRLVRCPDDELAAYYGLLDGLMGNTADSVADSGGSETGITSLTTSATTAMTTMATTMTTVEPTTDVTDTDPTDTDPTDPTGNNIDYPPECDTLMAGPFEATDQGLLFDVVDMLPPLGPEDLAMDGNGGLVARSGSTLRRYTLGDPLVLDASFTPPSGFTTPTLGIRYTPDGDLVMMQRAIGRVEVMHPDYTVETLLMQSAASVPNGLYVDPAGVLWTTFYGNSRVMRYDPSAMDPEFVQVAMQNAANGILFDPLRSILFYLYYSDGFSPSQVWSLPIDAAGEPVGDPAVVVEIDDAFGDGLGLDVCGNLYVVDQGGATDLFQQNTSRVFRVFMDDFAELDELEELIVIDDAEVSNIAWGDGAFATTAYLIGLRGHVFTADLQIAGAPHGATPR